MDFLRALENDTEIQPDKESAELLGKLEELQLVFNDLEELDEGAFDVALVDFVPPGDPDLYEPILPTLRTHR